MIELYPQIKLIHIVAVTISGSLFLVRSLGVQLGHAWPMAPVVRHFSYSVDTLLLSAAMVLMFTLHEYPGLNSWLTVKVVLVLMYIVLGSLALKRARTRTAQRLCALGACLVFGMIVSIAITHQPLGLFARWIAH